MMPRPRLLLIGCGKMGRALLDGWLARGSCGEIAVVDPAQPADIPSSGTPVRFYAERSTLPERFRPDATVLAIKPQLFDEVLPPYRPLPGLVVSIAAGRTLAGLSALLGSDTALVRAMPNTPAAVGRGVTALVAGTGVTAAQRTLADGLLAAVGEVVWLEEEGLLDAVTALSGGGPAYVFLLIEALSAAGTAAGLPAPLAERLARVTVAGSGELARLSSAPAAVLRQNVTSPNGTTEAALEVLMGADGMAPLFERAVAAAAARSRELAN